MFRLKNPKEHEKYFSAMPWVLRKPYTHVPTANKSKKKLQSRMRRIHMIEERLPQAQPNMCTFELLDFRRATLQR